MRSHNETSDWPCDVPPGSYLRVFKDLTGYADCYVITSLESSRRKTLSSPLHLAAVQGRAHDTQISASNGCGSREASGCRSGATSLQLDRRASVALRVAARGLYRAHQIVAYDDARHSRRRRQVYATVFLVPLSYHAQTGAGSPPEWDSVSMHCLVSIVCIRRLLLSAASRNLAARTERTGARRRCLKARPVGQAAENIRCIVEVQH